MKKLSLLAACVLACYSPTLAQDYVPEGFKLVWSDEFNGSALDEDAWSIEVNGDGGGNQELQYYRRENVNVEDGNLVITARRENYMGKQFTSGRVNSKKKSVFKHGLMQARIKMPHTANGLWPAYWMMGNDIDRYGWPRCGEIDIVEMGHYNALPGGKYAGWQDRYFSGTIHYGPNASNEAHQQYSQEFSQSVFQNITPFQNDEYHLVTIYWDDNVLEMYYDITLEQWEENNPSVMANAMYFSRDVEASNDDYAPGKYFQKPFYFLFNLAVGGTYTGLYNPSQISALPEGTEKKMMIDWVRVYQDENDDNAQYLYYEDGEKVTNISDTPDEPTKPDEKTVLSGFASQALDEDGETTFDFDDCEDVVLISTSDGVTGHFLANDAVLANYNVDEQKNFMYVWDGTYASEGHPGGINSFGWEEGYTTYYVTTVGWSGMGFSSSNGNGKDLSMLDDNYWLHFALRANDPEMHSSHTILIGDAQFIIGESDGKLASIGDFKRDGQWYYFDIPMKVVREMADPIFNNPNAFEGNAWAIMSGGVTDTEISMDNIFFYKSKTKTVPAYTTDVELGKYGYKSLDEDGNAVFDVNQCAEIIPLSMTEDMWKGLTSEGTYQDGDLIKEEHDYTMQGGRSNFFVWDGTFKSRTESDDVTNSTGVFTGPITSYASIIGPGWNGMGFSSDAGMGFNPGPKDLSVIDDNYYLHFSVRSDAAVGHVPVMFRLGSKDDDASIVLGEYSTHALMGDFNRDGEWYSFDIPVAELKRYGKLWGEAGAADAGPLNAYKGYALCIYTMPTYYSGSWFSFDNVFFWRPADGTTPEVNPLGDYTTKSLDVNGESTFDFDGKDFINFYVSGGAIDREGEDNILAGYYTLYNWNGNSYVTGTQSGTTVNSLGDNEGWLNWRVGTDGLWSGGGFLEQDGADLSVLEDGDWYLHFAMRGTDNCNHRICFAEAKMTIGSAPFDGDSPVIGNYERDGEWYSYDIPWKVIKGMYPNLLPSSNGGQSAYHGNLVWFQSGSHLNDEIQLDQIFFWRDKNSVSGIEQVTTNATKHTGADGIWTLSGVRVNDMKQPGIYIVRHNNQVRKVMVR